MMISRQPPPPLLTLTPLMTAPLTLYFQAITPFSIISLRRGRWPLPDILRQRRHFQRTPH
jgi:hypothetical protein